VLLCGQFTICPEQNAWLQTAGETGDVTRHEARCK
jgi:hypothetical protein